MFGDVNYINNNYYYYNRPQQHQDFMVIETDERAPIILGRPFLSTSRAVIYASAPNISFYIKGKKETFLQEQDYTNFRAIPTWTKGEDQQEEQEQANVDRVS